MCLLRSTFFPHSVFTCFAGSQKKLRLFPYTQLTGVCNVQKVRLLWGKKWKMKYLDEFEGWHCSPFFFLKKTLSTTVTSRVMRAEHKSVWIVQRSLMSGWILINWFTHRLQSCAVPPRCYCLYSYSNVMSASACANGHQCIRWSEEGYSKMNLKCI